VRIRNFYFWMESQLVLSKFLRDRLTYAMFDRQKIQRFSKFFDSGLLSAELSTTK